MLGFQHTNEVLSKPCLLCSSSTTMFWGYHSLESRLQGPSSWTVEGAEYTLDDGQYSFRSSNSILSCDPKIFDWCGQFDVNLTMYRVSRTLECGWWRFSSRPMVPSVIAELGETYGPYVNEDGEASNGPCWNCNFKLMPEDSQTFGLLICHDTLIYLGTLVEYSRYIL